MTDSRSTENPQGVATKERVQVKTVVVGQEFEFFDKPIESATSEIMETADLKRSTGELIGGLIGTIFNPDDSPVSVTKKLNLAFEVRTNTEKEQQSNEPILTDQSHHPYPGFPLYRPVLYAYVNENGKRKTFASLGVSETGKNARRIIFNQWLEVEKEDKGSIEKGFKNHKARYDQAFYMHQLLSAKYKLT